MQVCLNATQKLNLLLITAVGFPGRLLPAETTSVPSRRDICRPQACPPDMTANSKKKRRGQSTADKRGILLWPNLESRL